MPRMDTVDINGADAAILRRRGVAISRVFQAGVGDYHVIYQAGYARPLAAFHPSVVSQEDAPRIVQLGAGAAPGGANLAAGETSQQVLAFDDAGAPANSDLSFRIERR